MFVSLTTTERYDFAIGQSRASAELIDLLSGLRDDRCRRDFSAGFYSLAYTRPAARRVCAHIDDDYTFSHART